MGRCYNSTIVDAPIKEVWDAMKDFYDMSWAPNAIESVENPEQADGLTVGARRILNGAFHETLQSLDDQAHTFTYSIDAGPGPLGKGVVSRYEAHVTLLPVTDEGKTFVEWQATFESEDDDAVSEFVNPIYQALLADLKQSFA